MRKIELLFAILLSLLSCSVDSDFEYSNIPSVELEENAYNDFDVRSTSVTLHGKFKLHSAKVSEFGFFISSVKSELEDLSKEDLKSSLKIAANESMQAPYDYDLYLFSVEVNSLIPNTDYYFVAYISDGYQLMTSEFRSFKTKYAGVYGLNIIGKALSAILTFPEGKELPQGTQLGFCWGREESLLSVEGKVYGKYNPETHTFSAELPELDANTTYYFWAFSDTREREGGGSLSYSDPLKVNGPSEMTLDSNVSSIEAEQ